MLECINKECGYCENGKCKDEIYINTACKGICKDRIEPTHTPTYAEEQLEHTKENKTNLIEQVKKYVNYEEGYFELLKENEHLKERVSKYQDSILEKQSQIEELKETNKGLVEEIKDKNINYQVNVKELHEEIDQVMKEKEEYHTQMVILQEDNKEYKRANEGLAAESKERLQTIKKLQRQIEDNTENAILRNKVEDLEKELKSLKNTYNAKQTQWENEQVKQVEVLLKENTNLNQLIEKKDIKIEKLEKELDEKKSESAEYYLRWGDAESRANKLQGESNTFEKMVDILRAKGEEKDKLIEEIKIKSKIQIEAIKKLASLL